MKGRLALELIEVAWIMFTLQTKLCKVGLGGKETYAFFLDVQKAYDTVWRDGL